jgi:hypothetical protein
MFPPLALVRPADPISMAACRRKNGPAEPARVKVPKCRLWVLDCGKAGQLGCSDSGSLTGVDWAGAGVAVVAEATTSSALAVVALQLQAAEAELAANPTTVAQTIAARRMDQLHLRLSTQ